MQADSLPSEPPGKPLTFLSVCLPSVFLFIPVMLPPAWIISEMDRLWLNLFFFLVSNNIYLNASEIITGGPIIIWRSACILALNIIQAMRDFRGIFQS